MYLGLDLGTSSLKAIVVDARQQMLAEASAPLSVSRPADGWSEQDPAGWTDAAATVLAALAGQTDLGQIRGIGLSGHMHGAVLLAHDDRVLRPCILWNDSRASIEAAELDAEPPFRELSGNIVFPGFTAPKLVWVARHEPQIFDKVVRVLLPKDYLRLWLTGEHMSEMSDAAGTAWLDTGKRAWSDELLAATGLTRDQMPGLVEGSEVSGRLRADIAGRFGLPAGIPVAGGGGDNAAAGVGLGVVRAGEAFVSLGTSGVLFAASDGYRPDPATAVHTFCHAVPQAWHQMGVILAASDALSWLGRVLGASPAALTGGLGAAGAPGRALFLPYLGGERTPLNSSAIRGSFMGLELASDQPALVRAVLEGVAFALRDCRDALAATGTRIETLLATGGGARSDHWLGVIANVLNTPVEVPAAGEFGAALGAARLGILAAEGGAVADVALRPPVARTIAPDAGLIGAWDDAHGRFSAARDGLAALRLD